MRETVDQSTHRGVHMLLRGWLIALVVTLPAAAMHGIAHGAIVQPVALVVALVFAAAICTPLVGTRWSRMRSALAVIGSQLCFHGLFAIADSMSGPAAHRGHLHDPELIRQQLQQAAPHAAHQHAAGDGSLMAASHAVASVVTVGMLWYGHALLNAVCAWAQAPVLAAVRLFLALKRPIANFPATLWTAVFELWVPVRTAFIEAVQGRAPPVVAA